MATITVTNTNNSGNGSLRDAIARFQNGDTINFGSNLANQTITLSSQLSIGVDKKLTIDGSGASNLTISGNNASRVFLIGDYAEVTLSNLTIANGKASGDPGGAIKAGNFAKLTVSKTNFNNNTGNDAGAIQTGGYSKLNVIDSNFNGNTAGTGVGGAIRVLAYSNLSVSNSSFTKNSSAAGGAIETDYQSTTTVTKSRFESNNGTTRPTGYGAGAIASQTDGSLTVIDSQFINNLGDQGGAVYKGLGGLVIENSVFTGNSSKDGGGAVYADGGNPAGPNGTASTKGGLIRISGSYFENNKSVGEGGAVQLYQYYPDKAIVENSTFIGNSIGTNSDGLALGGAIRTIGDVTIRNVAFGNNTSTGQGGAIWYDSPVNSKNSVLNIENSTFYKNTANVYGGALTVNPAASAGVNIVNTTVDNNYAGDAGGAFWIVGGQNVKLTNSIVAYNTANDGKGSAQQVVFQLNDGGGNIESPVLQSGRNPRVVANSQVTDPKLGDFQSFGTVWAQTLQAGSPAINAGVSGGTSTDTRGFSRDSKPDIGAFEFGATSSGQNIGPAPVAVSTVSSLNEITGTSGNDTLTGTANSDRFIASSGADILTGGGGNDEFVYTDISQSNNVITDFEGGKYKIVFTQLLKSLGYSGSDPITDGYVKVVQGASSNNFNVQIDSDGSIGSNIFKSFLTVNVTGTNSLNNPSNFVF